MRKALKFLHTLGAIGLMGAMAALIAMHALLPAPSALESYTVLRQAMAAIANWVFFPSLILVLVGGLLSIAATRGFHDKGWVWIKLVTGLLVFEGSLTAIHGPMVKEAALSLDVLAGQAEASVLGGSVSRERIGLWLMMGVAVLNVGLGVWRPRLRRG